VSILLICFVLTCGAVLAARWAWASGQISRWLPVHAVTTTAGAPAAPTRLADPTSDAAQPVNRAALVLSAKDTSEVSKSPRYSIKARWPHIEWGSDPRVANFNQASDAIVAEEIGAFKKNVSEIASQPDPSDLGSDLNIDFAPTMAQNGIVSVLMRVSFYSAGAAHPGSYSRVINYDLRASKMLALQDLFKPNSNYLEVISAACLDDLKTRGVLGWEDRALPKPENYQAWNITPDGLLITFDEYQVAPYASGPQSVTIAYEKLNAIIRPDGPLSFLPR
jgi:hypothetical protein